MTSNSAIDRKIRDALAAGEEREWRQIADDIVVMSFPLRAFGIDFRRNVTLLRLSDRRVVIHSSAPFTEQDVAAIRRFGEPAWLLDATLMHDTFVKGWQCGTARSALSRAEWVQEGQRSCDPAP
jgi:hypothetical protein